MALSNSILKKLLNLKGCIIKKCEIVTKTKSFFDEPYEERQLLIHAELTEYEQCRCPVCRRKCSIYDHQHAAETKWRSVNLNGIPVFVCYRPARIYCPKHGVLEESIPWSDGTSRFTPDFNNEVAWMVGSMPRSAVATYLGINWRTVGNCIKAAKDRIEPDVSVRLHGLRRICVDETSYRKGYEYITLVYDMDKNRVVWVHKNHGQAVFEEFCNLLSDDEKSRIQIVAGDGAKWIDSCVQQYFPNAIRCIDFFHTVEWANEALDKVRTHTAQKARSEYTKRKHEFRKAEDEANKVREELEKQLNSAKQKLQALRHPGRPNKEKRELMLFVKACEESLKEYEIHNTVGRPRKEQFTPEHQEILDQLEKTAKGLKGAKHALGHDPNKCTSRQGEMIELIQNSYPELYKAYQIKETFRLITHMEDVEAATIALDDWISTTLESDITNMVEFAEKIKRHRQNLINSLTSGGNSAKSESVNTHIKLLIRMARGFRNFDNMTALIYLKCSDLVVPLNNRPQLSAELSADIRENRNKKRKEKASAQICS